MRQAVIGIGNLLRGDDGIGPRVIAELADRPLPENVELIDLGTGGLNLLLILEEMWDRVLIIDAAEIGEAPGTFRIFTADEVHLAQADTSVSLHNAGLADTLAMAKALERTLPPLLILGVQPAQLAWREGLSPEVEATLPVLARTILQMLHSM